MANLIVSIAKGITSEEFNSLVEKGFNPMNKKEYTYFHRTWKCKPNEEIMGKVFYSRDIDGYGPDPIIQDYIDQRLISLNG